LALYCNPDWQPILESRQFSTFEQIWNAPVEWIDEPNRNRGGWSGVGCIQLEMNGKSVTLYIKKQQNHTSRSARHPINGEPTFAKEFRFMRHLSQRGIMTPELVFFAQRRTHAGQQAILITRNLEGFTALDQINASAFGLSAQRKLIAEVASSIRCMHQTGVQHRALYAKHIFVKPNNESFAVAFIDFEKSRNMLLPRLQAVSDLITLNYRTSGWSRQHRLYFFKRYYALLNLSKAYKALARWIARRTLKKQYQWNRQA